MNGWVDMMKILEDRQKALIQLFEKFGLLSMEKVHNCIRGISRTL